MAGQVAATVAILVWLFSSPTLRLEMGRVIGRMNLAWLAAGVGLAGIELAVCAYRWRLFIRIQQVPMPYRRVVRIYLIAMFIGLFLPGRVSADTVRAIYLMRERPERKTSAALSITMDHVSGLFALLITAAMFTFWRAPALLRSPVTIAALCLLMFFFVLAMAGLALAFWLSETERVQRIGRHWPGAKWFVELTEAVAMFVRNWRQSVLGMGLSFVTLWAYFGTYYCSSRAVHAGCSLWTIFSVMPIVDVATALPLTVSGIGVRETLFQSLLHSVAGTSGGVAVLISLGGFACTVAWGLVGAVVFAVGRSRRAGGKAEAGVRESAAPLARSSDPLGGQSGRDTSPRVDASIEQTG